MALNHILGENYTILLINTVPRSHFPQVEKFHIGKLVPRWSIKTNEIIRSDPIIVKSQD